MLLDLSRLASSQMFSNYAIIHSKLKLRPYLVKSMAIWCFSILIPGFSFAQTQQDSLLFEKINAFRTEQGFGALVWDSCMYHAAKHQSDYMCAMGNHPT